MLYREPKHPPGLIIQCRRFGSCACMHQRVCDHVLAPTNLADSEFTTASNVSWVIDPSGLRSYAKGKMSRLRTKFGTAPAFGKERTDLKWAIHYSTLLGLLATPNRHLWDFSHLMSIRQAMIHKVSKIHRHQLSKTDDTRKPFLDSVFCS